MNERGQKADQRVVVVGGANTDIVGAPLAPLRQRISNPGTVSTSPGGVGRNIAENLARLGVDTHLVTAFGADLDSDELRAACLQAGIDTGASLHVEDLPGGRYVAINGEQHDLAVGVSDMRAIERLTPQVLGETPRRTLLTSATVVVLDANLPHESIAWIAENTEAPIVVDPVSAVKAERLVSLLGRFAAIKPNAQEATALLGWSVRDLNDAKSAATEVVAKGTGAAFVTPGREGIAWASGSRSGVLRSAALTPVNTSGAGDAFLAGVVFGMLEGADVEEQAHLGSALSMIALESEDTVSKSVSREVFLGRVKEMYG